MISIFVNKKKYAVDENITVFQALEQLGIEVPHFCYHKNLAIAGNCRMCLVEIEGIRKPVASCVMPVASGMKIHTLSENATQSRQKVMELLLANHPLDCPVCDKGGECDLQDQAYKYGSLCGNYNEPKRAAAAQNMGPMISTNMTRCIHCTRCIRFIDEIAGTGEIIMINRGENAAVTTMGQPIKSELSGNITDICPVGALTAMPYRFEYRPWELSYRNTIDVMDAVGSNIRVESKENKIIRILPNANYEINDEWIADKTRFAFDGLYCNRLTSPFISDSSKASGYSIDSIVDIVSEKLLGVPAKKIAAIAGSMADCESMLILKKILHGMGCRNIDCREEGDNISYSHRCQYIMNTPLKDIEKADFILLIGTNPRMEAPMVNYRIRKAFVANAATIFNIGKSHNFNYPAQNLGNDPRLIKDIAEQKHPLFIALRNSKNPIIIIGQGICSRGDGEYLLSILMNLAEKANVVRDGWNGFNVLQCSASRVGGLDLGFVPTGGGHCAERIVEMCGNGELGLLLLLGADELDTSKLGEVFVIYLGSHKDNGFHRSDIAIPTATYTEKHATYVNTAGKIQHTNAAVFPEGQAINDADFLFRVAKKILGGKFDYESLHDVRREIYGSILHKATQGWQKIDTVQNFILESPVSSLEKSFCSSDPISRASKTMVKYKEIFA